MKHAFLLAVVLLIGLVPPAVAGVLGDLGTLFMSNSTATSTMQSRDRTGVFGGSFEMRAPIKNVNVIAFDPPRLDAGCGGVDLYGGSFSFVTAPQLIDIFRKVAANAAGLAFKAAIKTISPSLDALISEFQALMQNLNNLAKNSCQMAGLVVDTADKALSNAVNGEGNLGSTHKGLFSDTFASLTNYIKDANDSLSKAGTVTASLGNQVAKAAVASQTSATMGMAGLGNPDGSIDNPADPDSLNNRLLYSILGYEIDGVPCTGSNEDGKATVSQKVSNNNMPRASCKGPASITLDKLMDGGGAGSTNPKLPLKLYQCLNPGGSGTGSGFDPQICTSMQKVNFNYIGVRGWVNQQLFGTPDLSAGPASVTTTSILGQMNTNDSTNFGTSQIQFVHQVNSGIMALLGRTSSPERRYSIAYRLSSMISNCIGSKLGEAIYMSASTIQQDNSYKLTDDQKANIRALRDDYMHLKNLCINDDKMLKVIQETNAAAELHSRVNR